MKNVIFTGEGSQSCFPTQRWPGPFPGLKRLLPLLLLMLFLLLVLSPSTREMPCSFFAPSVRLLSVSVLQTLPTSYVSVYISPSVFVWLWLLVRGCGVDQLRACSPDASPEQLDAYSAKIALCFNAYYNIYVDNATLQATQVILFSFAAYRRRYLPPLLFK